MQTLKQSESVQKLNSHYNTSVIIVGAGPVGLGLACELGQRGVGCVLIERRDGAINVPNQSYQFV